MDIMNPLADPTNVGGGPPPPAAGITPTQTGQPDMTNQWNSWLTEPGNRAMLGQMGAMLLQPSAPGQTLAGQIGQAVAGGAAAKTRNAELALKRQQSQATLDQNARQTQIQQQNADTSRFSAETNATFNQGYLQNLRQSGTDATNLNAAMLAAATAESQNPVGDNYGKSPVEITQDPVWNTNFLKTWQGNRSTVGAAPSLSSTVQSPTGGPAPPPNSPNQAQYPDGYIYTYPSGTKAKKIGGNWYKM